MTGSFLSDERELMRVLAGCPCFDRVERRRRTAAGVARGRAMVIAAPDEETRTVNLSSWAWVDDDWREVDGVTLLDPDRSRLADVADGLFCAASRVHQESRILAMAGDLLQDTGWSVIVSGGVFMFQHDPRGSATLFLTDHDRVLLDDGHDRCQEPWDERTVADWIRGLVHASGSKGCEEGDRVG